MREWVRGWSSCRGAPEPVEEADGFRIDVGVPGHRVRFVLPGTESVRERAAAEPGTWLKVCGRREAVAPLLDPRWVLDEPEFLMSTALRGSGGPVAAPAGYRTGLVREHGFHEVVVVASDGARAARGRFAVHGGVAVVDQVVTEPAHRRRGLGRHVMSTIGVHAKVRGAVVAVLVSTVEGRRLYESLGWRVDSEVVAAHLPETAGPPPP
ncbi:GNAT family N-acetyltransferase [Saccharothrix algeriensis]|uniref:GNAT superfamily N-acetyltransferase n=1 Tax=Saccharothrix algeriensis TaxID=173560 RepID=A0ABS2SGD6_9PSEU|nr:GNAT family N-acetyltransferase [Saccharothrix algeriensis]MBM7814870.1 GNAT superfamily N-acetyltransferase [Saccharothrix algeriensis]